MGRTEKQRDKFVTNVVFLIGMLFGIFIGLCLGIFITSI